MDEKVYTCFYCHSILPYEVCISGSHFCLRGSSAIEFWGNVVKMASAKSLEEQEMEEDNDNEEPDNKTDENKKLSEENDDEENETVVFPDIDSIVNIDNKSDEVQDEKPAEEKEKRGVSWKVKLINLVKERPPLYDKRLPLSERSFSIRAKLWKEVYVGLNGHIPIETLPKKFKLLRDRYNKELKRLKIGCTNQKDWSLMKHLSFLSNAKKKQVTVKLQPKKEPMEDIDRDDIGQDSADEFVPPGILPDFRADFDLRKKFVQLVGERPPLYDCRLPRQERMAEAKVKLWQEVYDAMGGVIPLIDLPRKFKSLRDRYMKEKKKGASSTWPLTKYMSYLDEVANVRSSEEKKRKSECSTSPGLELSDSLHLISQNDLSPLRNGILETSLKADSIDDESIQSLNKRKKILDDTEFDENPLKDQKKVLDIHENWDEDDFFGAYLVKLMKKIPAENKIYLHMEIMKMIQHHLNNKNKTKCSFN